MSGGGTNTVQTQSVPGWLMPYLSGNLQSAQTLEKTGQQTGTPMPIAPFSPLQQQGFGEISGMNPQAIGAADSSLASVLGGNYLAPSQSTFAQANPEIGAVASGQLMNPASNPYLQGTFNLGAQGIQNNLDSQFGAQGRNILASAPVQADQMSTLANDIYGGQYDANLNAMLGAQQMAGSNYNAGVTALNQGASLAPGVTQGLYTPADMLMGAGGQQQQQAQNIANAPYTTANWYSSLLGMGSSPFGMNSTSSNPSVNPWITGAGGALAGASTGAALGASTGLWGGPVGAGVGAAIGGLGGYLAG